MRTFPLIILLSAFACSGESGIHPALEVGDTPSGYYALRAELVRQDCYPAENVPEPLILEGRLEIYPRADLGAGGYYLRFERFDLWTPNFVLVLVRDDRSFEAEAVAPNFWRQETARIKGRVAGGAIAFDYVQDRPGGEDFDGNPVEACSIEWRMQAVRDLPAYEAVMELVKQDCYPDMDAYAHGFLMTVGPAEDDPSKLAFRFDSGNWWETFRPVAMDGESFSHRQEGLNPYQRETAVFTGTFDGEWLDAAYVQEREASTPEMTQQTGHWPECDIVWTVQARRI